MSAYMYAYNILRLGDAGAERFAIRYARWANIVGITEHNVKTFAEFFKTEA